MIEFKTVKVKNFLSIGDNPIEIEIKNGLNVIFGENLDKNRGNGSGKSTIIESIYFGLFGKTIRGLKKTEVNHNLNKKGAEIEIVFTKGGVNYRIERRGKPASLKLFVDGKELTRDSVNNTQSDIDALIGVSEEVIKNCVIMGVHQTVPFMAQTKIEKRKFIEGIFDMEVFSKMLKDARSDYNEAVKNLAVLQSKHDDRESNLKIHQEQSDNFEINKKNKLSEIKSRINSKKDELNEYTTKKFDYNEDTIREIEEKVEKLQEKLNSIDVYELKSKQQLLQQENKHLESQIDKLTLPSLGGECPTCGQAIVGMNERTHTIEHRNELTKQKGENESKINFLSEKIEKVGNTVDKIKQTISTLKDKKRNIEAERSEYYRVQKQIDSIKSEIKIYIANFNTTKEEVNISDEIITKIKGELVRIKQDLVELTQEVEVLDKIKFICGENGVKSYIFNKLLSIFNNKINFYLDKLDANCILKFDEFFEEQIINDKGKAYSYFNLSSGERRNIDIATMFAFMDIQKLQGKFDTNLLAFDELVDGCLDTNGVNYVVDILLEKCKSEGKSIYLITHRKELKQYATGESITVIKQNGVSTLVK